jgi:hypothetical protein
MEGELKEEEKENKRKGNIFCDRNKRSRRKKKRKRNRRREKRICPRKWICLCNPGNKIGRR